MDEVIGREQHTGVMTPRRRSPRIGILLIAYRDPHALASVLGRLPREFRSQLDQVFVCDDASGDSAYLCSGECKRLLNGVPLTVIRHPTNLGYGRNQKEGYRLAIEHDLDIIVVLRGDGRYAPECLEELIAPIVRGECDAVLGSRMMVDGEVRSGGMPRYKYLGNRLITRFENVVLRTNLSEFHSGYRAYSVTALASLPFERNSDGVTFDTQMIIQLLDSGRRIVEVPVPTYHDDQIRYLRGIKYVKDVSLDAVRYRLSKLGFLSGDLGSVGEEYAVKQGRDSSHDIILRWLEELGPQQILDLGTSSGLLADRVRTLGHQVTAVDLVELPHVRERVDRFVRADLDQGLPQEVSDAGPFDVVLAADVLEHLRDPDQMLSEIRAVLRPSGILMASVPNFGHWYARGRAVLGLFDYDQRGVLDRGHVRFFTRRSFLRSLRGAGFTLVRQDATGLPLDVLFDGHGRLQRILRRADRVAVTARPTLFGYQFVCQCEAPVMPHVISAQAD